jgi:4a-hydroxytetrahydrobiopterin dehydratase
MWQEKDNALYQKFTFKNFSEAFAFMTRVAMEAEKMDHHPRWTNVYNVVEIWLNTHSAGDVITEKDHALTRKIDTLL